MISAYFVIEKGSPYEPGTPIYLEKENILIGRSDISGGLPDINFENFYISREHFWVRYVDDKWYLRDIKGRHGTQINGTEAESSQSYRLQGGDRITLAGGKAIIRFMERHHMCTTADAYPIRSINTAIDKPTTLDNSQPVKSIHIDVDKMDLYVNDQCIQLAPKEWTLLELLYRNRNKVVGYDTIRSEVWTEYKFGDINSPDVTQQQIALLIYLLRKKMGKCRGMLITKKGRGCILKY